MKSSRSLRMLGALAGFAIFSQNHVYSAGTTLAVGDIAFTMYNSGTNSSTTSGDHRFSFVTLVDLAPSTVIYFTDVGLNGDAFQTGNSTSSSELFLQFTTSSAISKGTQISIGNTAGSTLLGATATGSAGTLGTVTLVTTAATSYSNFTGTALRLSSTGDEVFAYQTPSTFNDTPTILAGVNGNNGGWVGATNNDLNASSLPSYSINAINLSANTGSSDVRAAQFNFGSFTGSNDKAGWLAVINNVSNWTVLTSGSPFADSVTNLTISAIPEPSTYAGLAGVISLGLVLCVRRKRD